MSLEINYISDIKMEKTSQKIIDFVESSLHIITYSNIYGDVFFRLSINETFIELRDNTLLIHMLSGKKMQITFGNGKVIFDCNNKRLEVKARFQFGIDTREIVFYILQN